MKGKQINLRRFRPDLIRKLIWQFTDTIQVMNGTNTIKIYEFFDGSLGMAMQSMHDSFVCTKDGKEFLSVSQNILLERHGFKHIKIDKEKSRRNPLKLVSDIIETEGFDYALTSYTDFSDVVDEKFHTLREGYLSARKSLEETTSTIEELQRKNAEREVCHRR